MSPSIDSIPIEPLGDGKAIKKIQGSKQLPASSSLSSPPSSSSSTSENESSKAGVIMGGSVRATLLLLAKRISFKAMTRKRAFLTIGKRAETKETALVPVGNRRVPSKLILTIETMLMGMIVFGTYDGIVHAWQHHQQKRKQQQGINYTHHDDYNHHTMESTALHGFAGCAAGLAHSLFWMTWEALVYRQYHQPRFLVRTTFHHSIGYTALFGSYHAFRYVFATMGPFSEQNRFGMTGISAANAPTKDITPNGNNDNNMIDGNNNRLINIIMAGGLSGIVHHVATHYTSHWKVFHPKFPPRPRLRPTLLTFGPTSICFLAFEYGAETMEDLQQQGENILESYNQFIERRNHNKAKKQ